MKKAQATQGCGYFRTARNACAFSIKKIQLPETYSHSMVEGGFEEMS